MYKAYPIYKLPEYIQTKDNNKIFVEKKTKTITLKNLL